MSADDASDPFIADWSYIYFGLIVTGKGESKFLPDLFRLLSSCGFCQFEVITKVEQLRPRVAPKRVLELHKTGKKIPDKDAERIGFPARKYLEKRPRSYVILIDDLEQSGQEDAQAIFARYRNALDTILLDLKYRAAVHFLAYMLEAYYFANMAAVNQALDLKSPLSDYDSDVETIPHPKGELKKILKTKYNIDFDEVRHGELVVRNLDLIHILSKPESCQSLRTLFIWCLEKLQTHPGFKFTDLPLVGQKIRGKLFTVTQGQ